MKKFTIISVFMILIILMAACTSKTTQDVTSTPEKEIPMVEGSHYPVTITNYNFAGEEITLTFEKAPERVLAVYQGSIETMIALGLEDSVVASFGLDNEVKEEWKDGFSRMNYNDSSFAPDKETVAMLQPDLIFSWGSLFGEKKLGDVNYWIDRGTNTYMNTNTRPGGNRILENEYTDILNIGKIFNVEDKAEALVNQMKDDVKKTRDAVEAEPTAPTVAIVAMYEQGIRNYCAELPGDIVKHMGGTPIDLSERYISKEDFVTANPDVIIIEYMPRPDGGGEAEKDIAMSLFLDDPAFASMSAIENSRVYGIMLGDIYAPAVRTGDGIRTIAEAIYPGIFE